MDSPFTGRKDARPQFDHYFLQLVPSVFPNSLVIRILFVRAKPIDGVVLNLAKVSFFGSQRLIDLVYAVIRIFLHVLFPPLEIIFRKTFLLGVLECVHSLLA